MSSSADYYGGSAVPPTAAYGPPKIDFTPLADGLETYVKGKQLGRQEDVATAFRNGIPKDNGGNPDYSAMFQKMVQLGQYDDAAKLAQSGIQLQQYSNSANIGQPQGQPQGSSPPQQPAAAPQGAPLKPTSKSWGSQEAVDEGLYDPGPGDTEPKKIVPQAAAALEKRLQAVPLDQQRAQLDDMARSPRYTPSVNKWAMARLAALDEDEKRTEPIKNTEYDAENNNAIARHEAVVAGGKALAEAPAKIAQNAVREGARPVPVHPNEVVTTGSQLDPALNAITGWAAKRLPGMAGAPGSPAPAGGPPAAPGGVNPGAGGNPPAQQSAFTPKLIRNPDGSVASSVTPGTEMLQKNAAQNYEKAREASNGAQDVKMQLSTMEDAARQLDKAGWSSIGSGANARMALAKTVNSIWGVAGVKGENLPFDPNAVASWEKLGKETTRLGFSLARTLGAREAMQIVQGAIKANPNAENSPLGFKMVLNTIRQNAERQSDYFNYATNYAQTHGGDLVGAEVAFNKANPPALYARRGIVQAQKDIPQEAIEHLRTDPGLADKFDKKYGSDLAKMFLGNAGQ